MGNSKSTRKVTVANEEPVSNIVLSEVVVKRAKNEVRKPVEEVPIESQPKSVTKVDKLPLPINPESILASLPLSTSLQIRHEMEAQLRKSDQYWLERVAKVKEQFKMTDQKMEEEFQAAVQEATKTIEEAKDPADSYPCKDLRAKVIQCYQDHPQQSLLCSKDVKTFQACIAKTMQTAVENRG
ncbi:MICOS complex subunit MIC19 [Anabrus simplex]|uniref:MICOS complex subunit MIC19 n=1 Tax=Anabrus simplex TaxID=316456 RepID=UPI0034DD8101